MSVSFDDGGNLNPPPPKKSIDLPQVTDYLNYIHFSGVSHQQEKSEDTKEVIESCKSNGHKKNNKKTHKGKESITKKICLCSITIHVFNSSQND